MNGTVCDKAGWDVRHDFIPPTGSCMTWIAARIGLYSTGGILMILLVVGLLYQSRLLPTLDRRRRFFFMGRLIHAVLALMLSVIASFTPLYFIDNLALLLIVALVIQSGVIMLLGMVVNLIAVVLHAALRKVRVRSSQLNIAIGVLLVTSMLCFVGLLILIFITPEASTILCRCIGAGIELICISFMVLFRVYTARILNMLNVQRSEVVYSKTNLAITFPSVARRLRQIEIIIHIILAFAGLIAAFVVWVPQALVYVFPGLIIASGCLNLAYLYYEIKVKQDIKTSSDFSADTPSPNSNYRRSFSDRRSSFRDVIEVSIPVQNIN